MSADASRSHLASLPISCRIFRYRLDCGQKSLMQKVLISVNITHMASYLTCPYLSFPSAKWRVDLEYLLSHRLLKGFRFVHIGKAFGAEPGCLKRCITAVVSPDHYSITGHSWDCRFLSRCKDTAGVCGSTTRKQEEITLCWVTECLHFH
jgi:hypothetical protein